MKDKDYKQTSSHAAKLVTVRLVIALAIAKASQQCLYGNVKEGVSYVTTSKMLKGSAKASLQVERALCGLRQPSRQWNIELIKFLVIKH